MRELDKIVAHLSPGVLCRNRTAPRRVTYGDNDPPTDGGLRMFDAMDTGYTIGAEGTVNDLCLPANWGGLQVRLFYNNGAVHNFQNLNTYSLVGVFDFGPLKFIAPGDMEGEGWAALMLQPEFLRACVSGQQFRILLAPHHGHSAGVYRPILRLYQPHLTVMSAKYGDAHTDYDAYRDASSGMKVLDRTGQHVAVEKMLTTKTNDYVLNVSTHRPIRSP